MYNQTAVNTNTTEWRSSLTRARTTINVTTYALLVVIVVICFALPAQLIRNAAAVTPTASSRQTAPNDLRTTSAHTNIGPDAVQGR